ncbi:hypothetical protein D9756_010656 [Leucocoprinus leucothites]|uniref:Uncharacterized protein n=1 Tax=Leucocoprinus leucothites TaxID=201217 RepID=A0A8H5CTE4_9AGAR|nr:hypothetical protein D9756_010656 [Leucoagaricus leucothites]
MAEYQAVDDIKTKILRAMQDAKGEASADDEDEDFIEFKEDSSFGGGEMDENEIGADSGDDDEDEGAVRGTGQRR